MESCTYFSQLNSLKADKVRHASIPALIATCLLLGRFSCQYHSLLKCCAIYKEFNMRVKSKGGLCPAQIWI